MTVFALVIIIVAAYACGRRGHVWIAVALLCATEAAFAAVLAAGHGVVWWLVAQAGVVLAVLAVCVGAYRRLRHQLVVGGWEHAREAGLRERARIAASLHDVLGHDLALLSLRAGAIQVTSAEAATREKAAAIRAGAAEATETVRRVVDLLRADPDAAAVISRAQAAGMPISVTGEPPSGSLSGRVVAESLSNAARHAPGTPVTVEFSPSMIVVKNRVPSESSSGGERTGSGLAALTTSLSEAGGSLTAGVADDEFRLTARVPPGAGASSLAAEFDGRRRRARTVLTAAVLAPLGLLILIASGFYAWASHDTTIEPGTFRRLHVGMSQEAALSLLPAREAPIRLGRGGGPGCRHYTDGNFPLAYDAYVICFRDGVVASLRDRTGRSG